MPATHPGYPATTAAPGLNPRAGLWENQPCFFPLWAWVSRSASLGLGFPPYPGRTVGWGGNSVIPAHAQSLLPTTVPCLSSWCWYTVAVGQGCLLRACLCPPDPCSLTHRAL